MSKSILIYISSVTGTVNTHVHYREKGGKENGSDFSREKLTRIKQK
jgi:hypothetical protein